MSSYIEYNVIVNVGDPRLGKDGYITYHKVSSLNKFKEFVSGKYPKWKFATVYNNKTKEKIEVIKPR